MDSKICEQMKNLVGRATTLRAISESCDKLTFNNDLSTTQYASDAKTREDCVMQGNTWCTGSETCAATEEDCCAGKTSACQGCSKGTVVTSLAEGNLCNYGTDGTKGICHSGECLPLPETVVCNENTGLCFCSNGGQLCSYETGLCCAANDAAS